jgi:molybdenum cofactor cytidylyltransferase
VLQALVECHAHDLPAVVAPYVFDRRANPVLFDRVTFPDLLTLEGDLGGRAIFSKFSPTYMDWLDERLLMDVDTPDDYRRLLEAENNS